MIKMVGYCGRQKERAVEERMIKMVENCGRQQKTTNKDKTWEGSPKIRTRKQE
jgi:hypothetical protein